MPGLRLRRIQRTSACWTRHMMVAGFLVRYDGETGNLGFVKPGSVLIVQPPSIVSLYTRGHSVAVVDGRLFHGEGLGPNEHSRTGSAMVTVRDLEGSVQYRIGPRGAYDARVEHFHAGDPLRRAGQSLSGWHVH